MLHCQIILLCYILQIWKPSEWYFDNYHMVKTSTRNKLKSYRNDWEQPVMSLQCFLLQPPQLPSCHMMPLKQIRYLLQTMTLCQVARLWIPSQDLLFYLIKGMKVWRIFFLYDKTYNIVVVVLHRKALQEALILHCHNLVVYLCFKYQTIGYLFNCQFTFISN